MRNFLLKLVSQLVDHPEDVVVDESTDQYGQLYKLSVNPEDMGMVIGKSGRIIKSLRDLLKVKGIKSGEKASLLLSEEPRTDLNSTAD